MRRATVAAAALAGALLVGAAFQGPAMKITPTSHNFGQVVVNGRASFSFELSAPTQINGRDSLEYLIEGPDAGDFSVDLGKGGTGGSVSSPSPILLQSTCEGGTWQRNQNCNYLVHFQPSSLGRKTARLVVDESKKSGFLVVATLTGEGIFGCRPVLVPCNYADNYSGTVVMYSTQVGIAPPGNNGSYIQARRATEVSVHLDKGVVFCSVSINDSSTTFHGNKVETIETEKGAVTEKGLLSVEFTPEADIQLNYKITAHCPRPKTETYVINLNSGEVGRGTNPFQPAKLGRDPIEIEDVIAKLGADLVGGRPNVVEFEDITNGVTGTVSYSWSLKRW